MGREGWISFASRLEQARREPMQQHCACLRRFDLVVSPQRVAGMVVDQLIFDLY